jgi:hypothetical protein
MGPRVARRLQNQKKKCMLSIGLMVGLIGGCQAQSQPELVHVTGQLTVNGQPAVGAIVTLHPLGGGNETIRPTGQVNPAGQFELTSFQRGDGVPPGKYKVTVTWLQPPTPRPGTGEGDEGSYRHLLPGLYSNPETTPLRAVIAPGQTEPLRLEIKR